MKENKLFTRAAFYGRKTLTISVTEEQLIQHIKLKQQHEEERQQKQHEQILYVTIICTDNSPRNLAWHCVVRRIGRHLTQFN